MGEFKNSSEYTEPESPEIAQDRATLENRFSDRPNYVPRGAFRLYWPVHQIKINRGFRPAKDPNHQGMDLGGPKGAPILAAHEGIVVYTGKEFRGYGKMVLIEYNSEWATLYAHLDRIDVRQGQILNPGDPIGAMGRTGRASGVHLHFELMNNKLPIDPMSHLARNTKMASSGKESPKLRRKNLRARR